MERNDLLKQILTSGELNLSKGQGPKIIVAGPGFLKDITEDPKAFFNSLGEEERLEVLNSFKEFLEDNIRKDLNLSKGENPIFDKAIMDAIDSELSEMMNSEKKDSVSKIDEAVNVEMEKRRKEKEIMRNKMTSNEEEKTVSSSAITFEEALSSIKNRGKITSTSGEVTLELVDGKTVISINNESGKVALEDQLFDISVKYTLDDFRIKQMAQLNPSLKFIFDVVPKHDVDAYWVNTLNGEIPRTLSEIVYYLYMITENTNLFEYVKELIVLKESK